VDDLTHFDDRGRARMVDVGAKGVTEREARARGTVFMAPETLQLIKSGGIKKGDVLAVAQVAAAVWPAFPGNPPKRSFGAGSHTLK
jgi:cyclic pyranopterin phosphate synthase